MSHRSILHVEDDDATALLVKLALKEADKGLQCTRVTDVDAALRFLSIDGRDSAADIANRVLLDLVLLDLNLPRRSGFELLTLIRASKKLEHLRVVIFTSSSAPNDQKKALALGANGYITKPITFDEYVSTLEAIIRIDPQ